MGCRQRLPSILWVLFKYGSFDHFPNVVICIETLGVTAWFLNELKFCMWPSIQSKNISQFFFSFGCQVSVVPLFSLLFFR